jgi:NAD+ synthetase
MDCDLGCEEGRIEGMIRHALWSSGSDGIILGISGGVDSALTAFLCAAAVGGDRVKGLLLPSRITHEEDMQDARELCDRLGINTVIAPVQPILECYREIPEYTRSIYLEGNLTSRIRMTILYYYANRENRLVCGTSNRSEYMLGYSTKFGDGAADIQPLLHLYKTEVYGLARHLNLPARILQKPPSAGLWEGQTDEGEIGLSYAVIDTALQGLETNHWIPSTREEEVVLRLVQRSQHKRSPPLSLLSIPERSG